MSKLKVGLCPFLTDEIIDRLQKNGVYTVTDFISQDLEQLSKKIRLSCKDVGAMRRVLLAQFSALPVSAAEAYDDITRTVGILCTGSKQLDKLLEGGVYTMEVCEIVGAIGAGKTQLCMNVALNVCHSTNQHVVWVDTCGSFDIRRLQGMMEAKCFSTQEQESVGRNIHTWSALDAMELLAVLENIKQTLVHQDSELQDSSVRLIVVDSVTAVLSPLLSGYSPDGHSMMMQIGYTLKQMAAEYSLAVMMTNNLVGGDDFSSVKPALGRAWASMPHSRLLVQGDSVHRINPNGGHAEVSSTTSRTASLIKSHRQPCHRTVQFRVYDGGIEDIHQS